MLILHYTGMADAGAALDRLTDPAAAVSAHYLVDEDGTVVRLVDEAMRAWHAGRSAWEGERDVNSRSIGIELVNPGHAFGYRPFPEPQIAALLRLAGAIVRRHDIRPWHVLGHADVAPDRKTDPGELFPWARLAAAGIGLWLGPEPAMPDGPPEMADALREFGYDVPPDGLAAAIAAFQRHWRPARIDGLADAESCAILRRLLEFKHAGSPRPPARESRR